MTGLRFLGLKPRALQCYENALRNFFQWLEDESEDLPSRFTHLDRQVSQYLEHLWMDEVNVTYAGHLLSSLRRFHPQSRYRLPLSRQLFSNWKAVITPKQAVPMPATVVMGIAGAALSINDVPFAALVLVGFAAFLRTGEMTNLAAADVSVDAPMGRIILALPSTKTSRGMIDSVEVLDDRLAYLLQSVIQDRPSASVGGLTPNQFRAKLATYLAFFSLQDVGFSAYSLRRGGASHAFASGVHFDALLLKGRWQSIRTARLYLDSGRASLVRMQFSAEIAAHLEQFATRTTTFCDQLRRKRSKHR